MQKNKPVPKNHRTWLEAVLNEISDSKGITGPELCLKWPTSRHTVLNCVQELEQDGRINVGRNGRISLARPYNDTPTTAAYTITLTYREDSDASLSEKEARKKFLKNTIRNYLSKDLRGSVKKLRISVR